MDIAKKEEEQASTFTCSFCGKSNHEVRKLVAGKGNFICSDCIDLCARIIEEQPPGSVSDYHEAKSLPFKNKKMAQEFRGSLQHLEEADFLSYYNLFCITKALVRKAEGKDVSRKNQTSVAEHFANLQTAKELSVLLNELENKDLLSFQEIRDSIKNKFQALQNEA